MCFFSLSVQDGFCRSIMYQSSLRGGPGLAEVCVLSYGLCLRSQVSEPEEEEGWEPSQKANRWRVTFSGLISQSDSLTVPVSVLNLSSADHLIVFIRFTTCHSVCPKRDRGTAKQSGKFAWGAQNTPITYTRKGGMKMRERRRRRMTRRTRSGKTKMAGGWSRKRTGVGGVWLKYFVFVSTSAESTHARYPALSFTYRAPSLQEVSGL